MEANGLVTNDVEYTESGGDPVCWLPFTCEECGALIEDGQPGDCWRCGEPFTPR